MRATSSFSTPALMIFSGGMRITQRARQRGRNSAADVGIVDMPDHKARDLTLIKHRLPDMDIRRMGGHIARVGVVSDADVPFPVAVDQFQYRAVVDTAVPRRAEAAR